MYKNQGKIATETQEQMAIVKWLSLHPTLKDFYCKIPNDGLRSSITGRQMQLTGLRRGAADLYIYYPVGKYHGLFIEMKRNKRYTLSERKTETWIAQENFQNIVKSVGYAHFFCYGWEDAKNVIESYLLNGF
jgi:hypothetical protein